jgi:Tfp pilus assembly protein PilF
LRRRLHSDLLHARAETITSYFMRFPIRAPRRALQPLLTITCLLGFLLISPGGQSRPGASEAQSTKSNEILAAAKRVAATGDITSALELCNQAVAVGPISAEIHRQRATYRLILRNEAGALADYDDALRLRPDWPEVLLARGILRLKRVETAAGHADLQAATKTGREAILYAAQANRRWNARDFGGPKGVVLFHVTLPRPLCVKSGQP